MRTCDSCGGNLVRVGTVSGASLYRCQDCGNPVVE